MMILPTIHDPWPVYFVSGKLARWYVHVDGYETAMGVEP